jgi:hypothetical protein
MISHAIHNEINHATTEYAAAINRLLHVWEIFPSVSQQSLV